MIILAEITIGANQPAGSKSRAISDKTARFVYPDFLSIKGTLKKNKSSFAFQRIPSVLALFDSGRVSKSASSKWSLGKWVNRIAVLEIHFRND